MLLGPVYYPVELAYDLIDRGFTVPGTQELLEDPRVAKRAARQEDGGGARPLVGGLRLLGARQPAREQDRRGQRLDQLACQLVVRGALVLLRGVARVQRDA